jgi:glyoxylase-like metal-dependent hydrolase (beta-lactamase superfamily II)
MFLSHRDDVADHARYRARFGCERVIHEEDAGGIDAERYLAGTDTAPLGDGLLAIPTPGHTRGHVVLLYADRYLFTGDHLAWSDRYGHLIAFRRENWYSWEETIRSMERLREYRFEWVLPGHGRQAHIGAGAMAAEIDRCVKWMRSVR